MQHPSFTNTSASEKPCAVKPINEQAAQLLKQRAKDIYCAMKTPRHETIARRVGVTITQIKEWCDSERWLDARRIVWDQRDAQRRAERVESARRILNASEKLVALIEQRLALNAIANADLKRFADALARINTLQSDIFDELEV